MATIEVMSSPIQELIADVAQVTGSALPHVLADDAPVLQEEALEGASKEAPYFVGVIGGKSNASGRTALITYTLGITARASVRAMRVA